ncbi:hypothetical protein ACO0QE_003356 [Hanseniaspora vineae]
MITLQHQPVQLPKETGSYSGDAEASEKRIKRRLSLTVKGHAHRKSVHDAVAFNAQSAYPTGAAYSTQHSEPVLARHEKELHAGLFNLPMNAEGIDYQNYNTSEKGQLYPSGIFASSPEKFDTSYTHQVAVNKFTGAYDTFIKRYVPDMDSSIIIICTVWYICSSTSSNLTKHILKEFPHPIALTELQFCVSSLISVLFIVSMNFMSNNNKVPVLKLFPPGLLPEYLDGGFRSSIMHGFLQFDKKIFMSTLPMGMFQFFGHITSHKSTRLIPVSVVHSIKATSPIITVAYYRLVHNKTYRFLTYLTLVPLIGGVIMTCVSSSSSKKKSSSAQNSTSSFGGYFWGLNYAFMSMLIFVSQNIFAKNVLTLKKASADVGILGEGDATTQMRQKREEMLNNRSSHKRIHKKNTFNIDKVTISFYCSCIGFLIDMPLFIYNEFTSRALYQDLKPTVLFLVIVHGISHFIQTILAFQLIGLLSPVNYSIANIMKRICVILVAFVLGKPVVCKSSSGNNSDYLGIVQL